MCLWMQPIEKRKRLDETLSSEQPHSYTKHTFALLPLWRQALTQHLFALYLNVDIFLTITEFWTSNSLINVCTDSCKKTRIPADSNKMYQWAAIEVYCCHCTIVVPLNTFILFLYIWKDHNEGYTFLLLIKKKVFFIWRITLMVTDASDYTP